MNRLSFFSEEMHSTSSREIRRYNRELPVLPELYQFILSCANAIRCQSKSRGYAMNTKRAGNVVQLISCMPKGLLAAISSCTPVIMEELNTSMQLEHTVGIDYTSPASSSSSDDDAVNTTQARVYFGPLQSPEKKLIQVGNTTPFIPRVLPHDTNHYPIRRSESFPSPFRTQDQEDNSSDEAAEDVPHSRSGTPDNVHFPPDGEYHVITHWFVSNN